MGMRSYLPRPRRWAAAQARAQSHLGALISGPPAVSHSGVNVNGPPREKVKVLGSALHYPAKSDDVGSCVSACAAAFCCVPRCMNM